MSGGSSGMNDPFRNALMIEMGDLFAQDEIFQQGGTPSASL